jgi:hypothetical protein
VVKAIPQIVTALVNAVVNNIDKIISAGEQLFVALIQNLPTIIWEILKAVPQIITGLVDAFGTYFSTMSDVGLNLIKGLWQGISDAAGWLRNQISGFFGGVVQSIKDFFGIASPSKLFAELGGFMADGLGIGFGKEMQGVARDMQRAIPTDFNLGANIRGGYSLASAQPQLNSGFSSGANGMVNNFYISGLTVREEADIDKIAGALYRTQQQAQRGRGVAFA